MTHRGRALVTMATVAALMATVTALRGVPPEPAPADEQSVPGSRVAAFSLDCGAPVQPISPQIYGIGGTEADPWQVGARARRWGGNPTSRYNWRLNAFNLTKDWFFKNAAGPKGGYRAFLDSNRAHHAYTALTVPMIGWVAKDTTSYAFSVDGFGPQQATAPEALDAGNGVGRDGKPLDPASPTVTSEASTPDTVAAWIRQIRADDGGSRSVGTYILDNEPSLWNSTHRDVHPDPTTYDELLEKTIAYGTAIRKADPEAQIAGPAEWGWVGYQYSAADLAVGRILRPDRRRHGDEPLIPWYLHKLREYEQRSGTRILDVLDVHFYPMGDDIGIASGGKIDPTTAARRIRSTRSLWDPSYKDESWIADTIQLIPRMKEWIRTAAPGLKLSVGEWNFGAETHMSGGLAVAEALGRFGANGLDAAYYWTVPAERSPAFWAFRAYTDFDGAGHGFEGYSLPVQGSATLTSMFASRDKDGGRIVAVLLNLSALTPLKAQVSLNRCQAVQSSRALTYVQGADGFGPLAMTADGTSFALAPQPYSITVLELNLKSAPPNNAK